MLQSGHTDLTQANGIQVHFVNTNAEHAKMALSMGQLVYIRDAHKICVHDGVTPGGVMCFTGVTPGNATQFVGVNGITIVNDALADKVTIGLDLCPALPVTTPDGKYAVVCDAAGNVGKAFITKALPPVATNDVFTVAQGGSVNGNVSPNDSDPAGGPLTYAVLSPPQHGNIVMTSSGTFQYIPTASYYGPDFFTYMVTNQSGLSATATVQITVTKTNNPPVAHPDTFSTPYQTTLQSTVAPNDVDVDGDPLVYSVVSGVAHGNLLLNTDGTFTYTPLAGFNGTDSFVYQVDDGKGGVTQTTATITVAGLLTATNDIVRCIGYADTVNTSLLLPTVIQPLGNDTDSAGRPFWITGAVLSSGVGTITHDQTSITFVPAVNQMAEFTITYTIANAAGDTSTATIRCLLGQAHYNSFGNVLLFIEYGDGVITDLAGNIYTP